ncbi:MAG: hypothetical protein BGO34_16885 [Bacteroidia bacterium 44-10]|nr:MAG: hypothetical protein BGO34_16885 [Bacteroidia bacterium 44-10]
MIDHFHFFFATGVFWTTLILSLVFAFGSTPQDKHLRNYNRAKYIMAFTYLLFTVFSVFIITGRLQELDLLSLKISILILFTFQLLLFTHVSLTLINYRYLSIRLLIYQLIPVIILCLLSILSNLLNWGEKIVIILFYSLLLFFVLTLLIVTRFFFIHYRKYRKRVDNYFSGVGTDHLRWIHVSYLFLLISSMAVIIISFTTLEIIIPFYILAILFYTGYAVHFLNYKNIFNIMRPVLREEDEKPIKSSQITFSQIEKAVEKWEQQKLFINPKITIAKVASHISTNKSYLSQYINNSKQKTFNEWINGLRIEEAKRLMTTNKNMTIEEVSEKVGYTDTSYFSKCFVKYTGITAYKWKNNNPM